MGWTISGLGDVHHCSNLIQMKTLPISYDKSLDCLIHMESAITLILQNMTAEVVGK